MLLNYDTSTNFNPAHRQSDFDREPGKVSKVVESLSLKISVSQSCSVVDHNIGGLACPVDTVSHQILNKEIEHFQKNLQNFVVQIDF